MTESTEVKQWSSKTERPNKWFPLCLSRLYSPLGVHSCLFSEPGLYLDGSAYVTSVN